jgi:phage gp29-like protein
MTKQIKKEETPQKPATGRVVSSVKSDFDGFSSYMNSMLSSSDSVLASIGGDYKLYDEILRDDQVKACFQQRRLAVVSSELLIEPGGESPQDIACAEALKVEVELLKFDNLTDKMLYDQFYGYAVSEVVWTIRGTLYGFDKIIVRDRSRFHFDNDCVLRLAAVNGTGDGIKCEPPYFWTTSVGATHDDEPYGLGLAHYLYWPVLFKRGGIKFWMKFIERFAQPSILGKYPNGTVEDDKDNLLAAIKSIASETGTLLPEGMTIELIEATRSGSADQAKLIEIMNSAISKIILGQTMTTDNGSSQSQAKVHMEVREDIIDSDANIQCESFQDGPATWFTEINFSDAKVPLISRKTEKEEEPAQRVERDAKIYATGYAPTQDYIDRHYGEGNYLPTIDPVVNTTLKDKTNFAEFAESQFPDQKELDDALDSLTDNELNDQMAVIIEPILDFAEKNGADKALKKMDEVYDAMDIDDLTDQLTQMLFVAEIHGRFNATK